MANFPETSPIDRAEREEFKNTLYDPVRALPRGCEAWPAAGAKIFKYPLLAKKMVVPAWFQKTFSSIGTKFLIGVDFFGNNCASRLQRRAKNRWGEKKWEGGG